MGLAVSVGAIAFDLQNVQVRRDQGRYHVQMRARLDAPAARSYAVFADPAQLPRLNPAVRQVQVLGASPDGSTRQLATEVRVCAAAFCRTLRQVQDMRYQPSSTGGEIRAEVIADRSDFRFGQANWTFEDCGSQRTCLQFDATLEPAFWVPPLIGPWLIGRALQREAQETSAGLERLARVPATPAPP